MSSAQNVTALRPHRGRFVKGGPGGPGRPRGSKNKKKLILVEVRHVRVDAPTRDRRQRPAKSAAKSVFSRLLPFRAVIDRFSGGFRSGFSRFVFPRSGH